MKICKTCKEEKKLKEFHKIGKWYRGTCKKCHNLKYQPATGKLNEGRFKKGHKPKNGAKKGEPGRNTGNLYSKKRNSGLAKIWRKAVLDRDGNKCTKCSSDNRLHAHHIKKWKDFPELRFNINNGQTLCNSCHSKEEGLQKEHICFDKTFKKGHVHSIETRKKISESLRKRTKNGLQ